MNEKFTLIKEKTISFYVSNKKVVLITLAVVVCLILAFIGIKVLKNTKTPNIAGNLNNYGYAVENDGWIYYVKSEDSEPAGIYKVKKNGTKTKKISDNYGLCFNVSGNYLYYIGGDYDDYDTNLIKMKLNGKKEEVLVKDVADGAMTVDDGWIYYVKDSNLCRIKTNGEDKEKVSNKFVEYYQIDGNWIYYIYYKSSTYYISKMKTDGEDDTKLAKLDSTDGSYVSLIVKGNKIYYIEKTISDAYNYEYSLYSMKKNGEKAEKICELDENAKNINMQEDYIYYQKTEDYDEYKIHRIDYNGKNDEIITTTEESSPIVVIDNWLFYSNYNEDNESVFFRIKTNGKSLQEL